MDRLAEIHNDLDVTLEEIERWLNHTTHSFEMISIAILIISSIIIGIRRVSRNLD